MLNQTVPNSSNKTAWKGYLSFTFVAQKNKTVVKDKQHFGPLVLQRPYYQELHRPTVLVIHPPGGVVGGDELKIEINCSPNSNSLVSTPAATKFYKSMGKVAKQNQTLSISENCEVEWLPQETLVFDEARVENHIEIKLASKQNKLIAWDVLGLGRPARNEGFESGQLKQSLNVYIEGKLSFKDALIINPESPILKGLSGLNNHLLYSTALFYCDDEMVLKTLLEKLQGLTAEKVQFGVTLLNSMVVMRVLGEELDAIKRLLFDAWCIARPLILDVPVVKPRIWNT